MRSFLLVGRLCERVAPRARVVRLPINKFPANPVRTFRSWQRPRNGRIPRSTAFAKIALFSATNGAALGAVAFVELSQQGNDDPEETTELRMLQASRKEIQKKVAEDDEGLSRIFHKAVLFLDIYIWEPICTGFRFLHLAAIFIPVLAAVPIIWIGARQPERDNEKSGTLWWYRFLVRAMEWAGPAFIKVIQSQAPLLLCTHLTFL